MKKRIYPIALVLEGKPCLVVGSGPEAARRARGLLEAGAALTVVAPAPDAELESLARDGSVRLERREFAESDLDRCWLAVLTDTNTELAARVAEAAERRRVLFAALDRPESSGFFHMAIARAGALLIAISTSGSVPALGRRLRQELERVLSEAKLEEFVERLAELREKTPSADRSRLLGRAVSGLRLTGKLELPEIES